VSGTVFRKAAAPTIGGHLRAAAAKPPAWRVIEPIAACQLLDKLQVMRASMERGSSRTLRPVRHQLARDIARPLQERVVAGA
jgi:hypothetical protein